MASVGFENPFTGFATRNDAPWIETLKLMAARTAATKDDNSRNREAALKYLAEQERTAAYRDVGMEQAKMAASASAGKAMADMLKSAEAEASAASWVARANAEISKSIEAIKASGKPASGWSGAMRRAWAFVRGDKPPTEPLTDEEVAEMKKALMDDYIKANGEAFKVMRDKIIIDPNGGFVFNGDPRMAAIGATVIENNPGAGGANPDKSDGATKPPPSSGGANAKTGPGTGSGPRSIYRIEGDPQSGKAKFWRQTEGGQWVMIPRPIYYKEIGEPYVRPTKDLDSVPIGDLYASGELTPASASDVMAVPGGVAHPVRNRVGGLVSPDPGMLPDSTALMLPNPTQAASRVAGPPMVVNPPVAFGDISANANGAPWQEPNHDLLVPRIFGGSQGFPIALWREQLDSPSIMRIAPPGARSALPALREYIPSAAQPPTAPSGFVSPIPGLLPSSAIIEYPRTGPGRVPPLTLQAIMAQRVNPI